MSRTDRLRAETVPLDEQAAQRLAATGLEYRTVPVEGEAFDRFAAAINRGFLRPRPSPENVQGRREGIDGNRLVGVYDPSGVDPGTPVGTINSWVMDLTVDADSYLPMWSIAAVTVSATHRRRGIARAIMEGELRAAAGAGVPIAGLTVSEATIYGRYGFGSAAHVAHWTIDNRRAGWIGPRPTEGERPGRLDHIEREDLARDLATLNETTRGRRPGDIEGWPQLWLELAGLRPGKTDVGVRGVRYTDADGTLRGVVAYTFQARNVYDTRATLHVQVLLADGRDAYAALWRHTLEHDRVITVIAGLRGLDEPLRWMIADERALQVRQEDHHWLRILDVPRCLGARRFRVAGKVTFAVSDPLGIADGVWRLEVDASGSLVVEPVPDGAARPGGLVTLGIGELSTMLLGGVRASTLLAAGRIDTDGATAGWLDLAFAPVAAPMMMFEY